MHVIKHPIRLGSVFYLKLNLGIESVRGFLVPFHLKNFRFEFIILHNGTKHRVIFWQKDGYSSFLNFGFKRGKTQKSVKRP